MPSAQRSRTLPAAPADVWQVIADPHHMPRWWPEVARVEGVQDDRFTHVYSTRKGRQVRMDFLLVQSEPPGRGGDPPGRLAWTQELVGTPFERFLNEQTTEVLVEPAGAGALVTISLRQRLRGVQRTGGFLLARATRRRLDQALDGLEEILTDR
jgi:uncharacterized protein YndB with AHSA1/START domain